MTEQEADPGILERWGPVRGWSPEPSAEGASAGGVPPQKILKNWMRFPAIWHIFLGSERYRAFAEWVSESSFLTAHQHTEGHAEQKTVAATISIHTHTRIHPYTSKNSSDFGHYKIKIQFQKYFFRHCIYNVENKTDFAKNGARHLDPPLRTNSVKAAIVERSYRQ